MEKPMTAREFMNSKYPDYEKHRDKTGHDDVHQEEMMEEYAKQQAIQFSLDINGSTAKELITIIYDEWKSQ